MSVMHWYMRREQSILRLGMRQRNKCGAVSEVDQRGVCFATARKNLQLTEAWCWSML
jgi:hypothetical protein